MMTKITTTCTICGEKFKNDSVPASCPVCNVSLAASQAEVVLKKGICSVIVSGDTVATPMGDLILTNQRIFWVGDLSVKISFNNSASRHIMGGLTNKLFPRPKQKKFCVSLAEIVSIEIIKKGPFKVLTMKLPKDKLVVLNVRAKNRQEWVAAVNDAKASFADASSL